MNIRLLRCLLIEAISDLLAMPAPGVSEGARTELERRRQDAAKWVMGQGEALVPFEQCCAAFGMAPEVMRARIEDLLARPVEYRRGAHRLGKAHRPEMRT